MGARPASHVLITSKRNDLFPRHSSSPRVGRPPPAEAEAGGACDWAPAIGSLPPDVPEVRAEEACGEVSGCGDPAALGSSARSGDCGVGVGVTTDSPPLCSCERYA